MRPSGSHSLCVAAHTPSSAREECVLLWSVGPSELGGCRPESSESENTELHFYTTLLKSHN